jgi:biotin carboxylase
MATLLFLGASVSQLPAIRYARAAGHRVVAVDGDPDAVAFDFCDVAEHVDFTDVERVTQVGARVGAEGVLAISTDRAVPSAAAIAARLGLPGIGLDVAESMTDKAVMRARLERAGVPQPRFAVLTATTDVDDACTKVEFPAVLKPVDSGGQRGVYRVGSPAQVRAMLESSLAYSRSGRVLLEEFVEGTELNGILIARRGEPTLLTLSDRLRPPGIGFGVGWIHSFPSSLPSRLLTESEDVAIATVRSLGLRDGIAFPQLIAGEAGVRVVEIAARIPAGQMADLVSFGVGINLFEIAIQQALGHAVPDALVTPAVTRPIVIRFLTASPGVLPLGTVTEIEGLADVQAAPGVLAAGLYFGPGTTIGPVQVDADRRGYVVATAETPARALELADAASRKLVVRTEAADHAFDRGLRLLRTKYLVPAATLAAIVLTGGVLAITTGNQANLHGALLFGVRVDRTITPLCRCRNSVARMTFSIAHAAAVTVQMMNSAGRPVATLFRDHHLSTGRELVLWNGRSHTGHVLPEGTYFPQFTFPSLDRTVRLRTPIRLETERGV